MRNQRWVLMITLLSLAVVCSPAQAQSPPVVQAPPQSDQSNGPRSIVGAGKFESLEGRFSISLPQQINGLQQMTLPTQFGVAKGPAYIWEMKEAAFVIGHVDAPQSLEETAVAAQFFNGLREQFKQLATANNGQVGAEKEIRLDTHPGLEQRLELFTGLLVQRTYIVGSRLYQTVFVVKAAQQVYVPLAMGVLDTLKLLNERELAAKESEKAAAAEPSPLPQTPATQRVGTDATDEALRGPIKNVLTESEDSSGTWSVQGRKRNWFDSYNEQGNLTRREFYDYRGNLSEITVYGYIDGNRVSSSKNIEHEYNPPSISVGIASGAKKSDPRYDRKFEFKYDDKKRLTEKTWFQSNGDVWLRYVYKYSGNQREELVYTSEGVLNQRYMDVLDDKGNEIEQTIFEQNGSVRLRQVYKYEFDSHGNWIKRTAQRFVTRDGREILEPDNVYYRTINYYK
jgi:hypothetical protein